MAARAYDHPPAKDQFSSVILVGLTVTTKLTRTSSVSVRGSNNLSVPISKPVTSERCSSKQ